MNLRYLAILILLMLGIYSAEAQTIREPLTDQCPNVGPLTPNGTCGCVIGTVYVDGQPLSGVTVTVSNGTDSYSVETDSQGEFFFDGATILANLLGAQYGDELILTAASNGESVTRNFRALADPESRTQRVNLVFASTGGATPPATIAELEVRGTGLYFAAANAGTILASAEWKIEDDVIGTHLEGGILLGAVDPHRSTVTLRVQDVFGNWSQPVSQLTASSCLARIEGDPIEFVNAQAAVDQAQVGTTVKLSGICSGVEERTLSDSYPVDVILKQVINITKTLTLEGGYEAPNWTTPNPTVRTIIDAEHQGRGIAIPGNYSMNVILRNLHIMKGDATNLGDGGGGLFVAFTTVTVEDTTISDSRIHEDVTYGGGGGFSVYESLAKLSRLTVRDNYAPFSGGGGVFGASEGFVRDSQFINNSTDYRGGGLVAGFSDVEIENNIFRGNQAKSLSRGQGGGLSLIGFTTVANVERNLFIDNAAGHNGGGLAVACDGLVSLTNNVIANNFLLGPIGDGAGASFISTSSLLQHNTIANNRFGAGIYTFSDAPTTSCDGGDVSLTGVNNIVSGHETGVSAGAGTIILKRTLWWANGVNSVGSVTDSDPAASGDPLFVNPTDGDYHLSSTQSPAVDTGIGENNPVRNDLDAADRPQGGGHDIGADEVPPESYSHRIQFIFAADNNLSFTLEQAIEKLQNVATNLNLAILVLYDGDLNNDSKLVRVLPTGVQSFRPTWMDSEINTGDPQITADYLEWGKNTFPADTSYITISSHGGGVNGIAPDTRSNDYLTAADLQFIAQQMEAVDMIHFDACSMGMVEVAYAFRDKADYMVASSSLAWGIFSYADYYADGFTAHTPLQQAVEIAQLYHGNPAVANRSRNIAVYDLDQMDALTVAIAGLVVELQNADYSAELAQIIERVQRFDSEGYYTIDDNDEFIDLYHFAQLVEEEIDEAVIISMAQALQAQLRNVMRRTSPTIVEAYAASAAVDWPLENSYGIGIFYPSSAGSSAYFRYLDAYPWSFSGDSSWGELLLTYFGEPQGSLGEDSPELGPTLPPAPSHFKLYLPAITTP